MIFETDFMKLYEELGEINGDTDLESIVNTVVAEVEKYDKDGSNQNCLFSTWAVELQLRGEDFLPRPVYSPRDPIFDIKGEELVADPEVLKISSKEDVETQVLEAGDGARFYCHVNWADSKGGHEFLLINDNDSVLVVDGQAGYINEITKDKKYFDDINFENSYIVRFDNKEINQDILKYNDEDQIIEWDDELDPKLLEEGLSQIDYLPVSDIELFKEYADDILDGYGNMSDADIKSSIKEIHFEGKLAGYIGFSEYEENRHKCLGIGNFMIIERGKGLGSAVIQNIVDKYKNQYDLIYCFVDAKNDGAIRLYKKLGKVYDEDGPNDNGEYYVTFWDNGKWELNEGKKNKKIVSVQSTSEVDLDSFLKELGLVPISMIAPACSDTSPSGATVWAPAEPHSGGSYQKTIPKFETISTKRLPRLVATLDETEYPNKMFTTDDILNNGGRKLKEVRIGDAQGNPCRGLWFRTRSGNKRYFIFGSIFYKNTQKINAATNSEVTQANKIYDAVMKKLGNN